MKRQVPTERDIANQIVTAFERLPEPDARRLTSIEQQLLEPPRLRGRTKFAWWWLVGALVAGAASAWWWVVDYDSGRGQEEPTPSVAPSSVVPSAAVSPTDSGQSENTESKRNGAPAQKNGPMIYRRER